MNTRRGLAMVVTMGLVVSGWVVLTARQQAYADPPSGAAYRPLTGVGSATTQDVMNALAEVITVDGQKVLGSFNASGSERVTTFDPSNLRTCDFPRPATDEAAMSRLLFSAINRDTSSGQTSSTLRWDKVQGASGFRVYRRNVTTGEMLMLNPLADELNSVIAETVDAVSNPFLSFVDVRNLFSGHDMCAGGAAWLHRVGIPIRESAHPNMTGFDALAFHIPRTFLGVDTSSGRR